MKAYNSNYVKNIVILHHYPAWILEIEKSILQDTESTCLWDFARVERLDHVPRYKQALLRSNEATI